MFTNDTHPIVVLHDLDDVRAELLAEIRTAGAAERPGLEAALRVVDRQVIVADEERVRRWASRILAAADVDPALDMVRAVKVLRDAVPGLGLISANDLVKSVLPR
ncbi:hypothetical protein ACFVTF_03825 [Kitasatospora sp. NPDC057940]|uniref:hypothetical protein n=1 Tax=Kitasatospora sp. NPDC057940 TaxID=3346285 RepID=UPI0036DC9FAF